MDFIFTIQSFVNTDLQCCNVVVVVAVVVAVVVVVAAAFTRLGLMSTFASASESLTLIAPTNSAFEQLPVAVTDETDACLNELMKYYVIDRVFCSKAASGTCFCVCF